MVVAGGTAIWKVLTMTKWVSTRCGKEWALPHWEESSGIESLIFTGQRITSIMSVYE